MKNLSHTQLFILKTLREGGQLILSQVTYKYILTLCNSHVRVILPASIRKLRNNGLINIENCLTNSGLEAIQEAEIKEHKRVSESF